MLKAVRFGLVGVANTFTDVLVFIALTGAGIGPAPANCASFGIGTLQSYVLNRSWTFRLKEGSQGPIRQFAAFLVVNVSAAALTTVWILVLIRWIPAGWAKITSLPVSFIWNFFWNDRFVFSSRRSA